MRTGILLTILALLSPLFRTRQDRSAADPVGKTNSGPPATSPTSAASRTAALEVVTFPSGKRILHGVLYRPSGSGPFPAVLYNHGSARDSSAATEALGPVFASRGW